MTMEIAGGTRSDARVASEGPRATGTSRPGSLSYGGASRPGGLSYQKKLALGQGKTNGD